MAPFADASDLTIDAAWDNMCDVMHEEELPPVKEEVCTVLKEWTSDEESVDVDIMEVDEQIGSNFLCDDLFGGHCPSPVSPQEEFHSLSFYHRTGGEETKFLTPPLSPEYPSAGCSSSDDKYRMAFQNLMASMKKSQETRACLTMKTSKASDAYARRKSVSAVLNSIEQSRCQIQTTLGGQLEMMSE